MKHLILQAFIEIAKGNFSHRIENIDYNQKRLAAIATGFNMMAEELQANHSLLYEDRRNRREMKFIHDELMQSYKDRFPITPAMKVS